MGEGFLNLSERQALAAIMLYGLRGLYPAGEEPVKRGSARMSGPKIEKHRKRRKKLLKLANKSRKINRLKAA